MTKVLLVHGVGVGPEAFIPIAAGLTENGLVAVTASRPGYDRTDDLGDEPAPLDRQVRDITDLLARPPAHTNTVWVGVSGGATLGLLAAERHPRVVERAILHEPLTGTLTPEIHEVVVESAELLDRSDSELAAVDFIERLIGADTWERLGPEHRSLVRSRADIIAREVREFVSYDADPEAIITAGVEVTITVGERSSPVRHRSAEIVATAIGGDVVCIPGAGHLPHVDAPDTYTDLIRRLL